MSITVDVIRYLVKINPSHTPHPAASKDFLSFYAPPIMCKDYPINQLNGDVNHVCRSLSLASKVIKRFKCKKRRQCETRIYWRSSQHGLYTPCSFDACWLNCSDTHLTMHVFVGASAEDKAYSGSDSRKHQASCVWESNVTDAHLKVEAGVMRTQRLGIFAGDQY